MSISIALSTTDSQCRSERNTEGWMVVPPITFNLSFLNSVQYRITKPTTHQSNNIQNSTDTYITDIGYDGRIFHSQSSGIWEKFHRLYQISLITADYSRSRLIRYKRFLLNLQCWLWRCRYEQWTTIAHSTQQLSLGFFLLVYKWKFIIIRSKLTIYQSIILQMVEN